MSMPLQVFELKNNIEYNKDCILLLTLVSIVHNLYVNNDMSSGITSLNPPGQYCVGCRCPAKPDCIRDHFSARYVASASL